jgi:hypothetical protein
VGGGEVEHNGIAVAIGKAEVGDTLHRAGCFLGGERGLTSREKEKPGPKGVRPGFLYWGETCSTHASLAPFNHGMLRGRRGNAKTNWHRTLRRDNEYTEG